MREGLENASLNPSQVFEGLTSLDSVPKSKMTDAAALDPAERIFRRRRHLLYVTKPSYYTLFTPFRAVHTPMYTRYTHVYTCIYTIHTPNTPLNTLNTP